jgi:2-phosphosulfolactate phosphatase
LRTVRNIGGPNIDIEVPFRHPVPTTSGADCERLYAGSLVTANATARALLTHSPEQVTIVAMGNDAVVRTDEDELCAIHLRNLLEGRPGDVQAVRQLIHAGGEVARFRDPSRPHLHPCDLEIALDVGRYNTAIRVEDGRPVARSESPI